jgi:hypothetical protein
MGFLDRAKKLAHQAKDFADDQVEQRRQQSKNPTPDASTASPPSAPAAGGPTTTDGPKVAKPPGTPAGPLGEKWKALGLPDPAGVVPPRARQGAGVHRSTHSEVLEAPYGVGRRWTAEGKSIGVFWLIDGSVKDAAGTVGRFDALKSAEANDVPDIGDAAYFDKLEGGRHGVFVKAGGRAVVVEVGGIEKDPAIQLAQAASMNMSD